MKNIKDFITEARQEQYRVSFLDVQDKEGLPITVTILVDRDHVKAFEDFLEKEQDNLFFHAEGGDVEY